MKNLKNRLRLNHLAYPLLILMALGVGYAFGQHQDQWSAALLNKPVEDRESFCQMEWIIGDFQSAFVSAYCDSMQQATADRSAWRNCRSQYAKWLETRGLSDTPQSRESFRQQSPTAPNYDPAALAQSLTRWLEKLESNNPAPMVIRDLLRVHQELGQQADYRQLLSWAQQRFPEHSFADRLSARTEAAPGER